MFLRFLHAVVDGRDLSAAEASDAMLSILNGEASTPQLAAFLAALKVKGETAEEVEGFARAMQARAERVDAGSGVLDTCGTGGGRVATFNISTVSAFVVAGAGVKVAKHGNRSYSSECGSADLLEALGIPAAASPDDTAQAIRKHGIGFLFAPVMHPAMKHAAPARAELRMDTVFNMLGPLTNPAGAKRQLIGAFSERAASLMAQALAALGAERAFVVHGADGLDEITTTAETTVFEVRDGGITRHTWTPEHFGVERASIDHLRGGNPTVNCRVACAIFQGERGPRRDIVLVNAAAALMAAGVADSPREAMRLAERSLDSGAAAAKVEALRTFRSATAV